MNELSLYDNMYGCSSWATRQTRPLPAAAPFGPAEVLRKTLERLQTKGRVLGRMRAPRLGGWGDDEEGGEWLLGTISAVLYDGRIVGSAIDYDDIPAVCILASTMTPVQAPLRVDPKYVIAAPVSQALVGSWV